MSEHDNRDPDDSAEEFRSSTPGSAGPDRAAGGMGVSSERVGHAGPGQEATDGLRDVAPHERRDGEDAPPEQSVGNPEDNPSGLPGGTLMRDQELDLLSPVHLPFPDCQATIVHGVEIGLAE